MTTPKISAQLEATILFVKLKDKGWHHVLMSEEAAQLAISIVQINSVGHALKMNILPEGMGEVFDDCYLKHQPDARGLDTDKSALIHKNNKTKN